MLIYEGGGGWILLKVYTTIQNVFMFGWRIGWQSTTVKWDVYLHASYVLNTNIDVLTYGYIILYYTCIY